MKTQTLFKYYVRFLPLNKRREAHTQAVSNQLGLQWVLPIPETSRSQNLRYCPMCVEEDRKQYGESYFHVQHLIPEIHICPKHCCNLVDTKIVNSKLHSATFTPLEMVVDSMDTHFYEKDNINIQVAEYIYELFEQPLDLTTDFPIGDYLIRRLDDKYLSPRGEQKNLVLLTEDVLDRFSGCSEITLTKDRIGRIFRNQSWNPWDISLLAMFEEIPPSELGRYLGAKEVKHIVFDNKVRQLYSEGMSMCAIGKEMGVNHEVVRQILLGTYDKQ